MKNCEKYPKNEGNHNLKNFFHHENRVWFEGFLIDLDAEIIPLPESIKQNSQSSIVKKLLKKNESRPKFQNHPKMT